MTKINLDVNEGKGNKNKDILEGQMSLFDVMELDVSVPMESQNKSLVPEDISPDSNRAVQTEAYLIRQEKLFSRCTPYFRLTFVTNIPFSLDFDDAEQEMLVYLDEVLLPEIGFEYCYGYSFEDALALVDDVPLVYEVRPKQDLRQKGYIMELYATSQIYPIVGKSFYLEFTGRDIFKKDNAPIKLRHRRVKGIGINGALADKRK